MYKYFQPNKKDLKDKASDCQIRALCKALEITWLEAFDLTIPICREIQSYTIFGSSDVKRVNESLKRLGFEYTGISNAKGAKRPTVKTFANTHKTGRYILRVANHVVAVVDGVYYDTWDCGYKSIYGVYELK